FAALVVAAENHFAGGGLMHRGHVDVDRLVDHFARAVDDHHRAVIQIRDTLIEFFAFAQDENAHRLARQHHGLQCVGQLIFVHDLDALQRGDFIQIEIVRHNFRAIALGHLDQLHVHVGYLREIVFGDLDVKVRHFLYALQHFETAPPALPLQRVRRISHELELTQHELRDDDRAVEKERVGDVGHAAVNDHAGIEHLYGVLHAALAAENSTKGLQVEHVALIGAEDQADIRHDDKDRQTEERPCAFRHRGVCKD